MVQPMSQLQRQRASTSVTKGAAEEEANKENSNKTLVCSNVDIIRQEETKQAVLFPYLIRREEQDSGLIPPSSCTLSPAAQHPPRPEGRARPRAG